MSAIAAIGSGRSSRSKNRRRNWPASHSMFHSLMASLASMLSPPPGPVGSVTYSGGLGSRARITAENMNAAERLRSAGYSSATASAAGMKTESCLN